jgi:tripartite-type tricarboxylate transporter receptor subunit TctC
MKSLLRSVVGALAFVSSTALGAPTYPTKPIRLVVPFPPGGPTDIYSRVLSQKLGESLGQQVVIDNRGGASGIIASEIVARAAADGHTLLLGGAGVLAVTPAVFAKIPYDPIRDFAPISMLVTNPFMLVVNPTVPVNTVPELIKLAKAKPGQLNFASAGPAGPPRLAAELFKTMTGVDIVHVPYNGGGPALTATMSGQVHMFFAGISGVLALVKDGKLKAIAVTSAKRTQVAPQLPTIAESGVPGFEVSNWYAALAPAATPAPIVTRLNAEIVKALNSADVRKRLLDLGADPVPGTPEEMGAFRKSELAKWAKVIRAAGIKPE